MEKPACDPAPLLLLSQMFLYNHVGQRGIGISIGRELALPWGPHEAGLGARWAAWGSGGSQPGAWGTHLLWGGG